MLQLTVKTDDPAVEAVLKTLESLGITDWGLQRDVLETAARWVGAFHQSWHSVATPRKSRDEVCLLLGDAPSSLS
jgi:hypothetical protein